MAEAKSPSPLAVSGATAPALPVSDRRSAEVALAVFVVVLLGLLAFRGYGTRLGARPTETVTARVDLNRAERSELEQIPGVGPKLAHAIDKHRREKPFRSLDELRDVRGVGPVTFDKVRPYLRVDAQQTAGSGPDPDPPILERKRPAPVPLAPRPPGARKLQPGDPPVNINTASAEQLQLLPGIGPATARNVVAARAVRPFKSIADLDRVKGIGPKTLDKLRPFVVAE